MNMNNTHCDSFNNPNLVCSEQEHPSLGKYGRMRRTYLKENFPAKYNWMVWQDALWPHLHQIDAKADELFRTIVDQMAKPVASTNSSRRTINGAGFRRWETSATWRKKSCCEMWCAHE